MHQGSPQINTRSNRKQNFSRAEYYLHGTPSHQGFFSSAPRSPFKKLFLGTKLGEDLRAMSFAKSVPEGLKWVECECGIGGNNSPVRYNPEQDPMQDALKKEQVGHVLQVDSTQHGE
jgi:hypothetical protein